MADGLRPIWPGPVDSTSCELRWAQTPDHTLLTLVNSGRTLRQLPPDFFAEFLRMSFYGALVSVRETGIVIVLVSKARLGQRSRTTSSSKKLCVSMGRGGNASIGSKVDDSVTATKQEAN